MRVAQTSRGTGCRHFALRGLFQGRAVDLVGGGERQRIDEPDPPRVLVCRRVRERILLDVVLRQLGSRTAHDECDRLGALDVVVDRHDACLRDIRMRFEYTFHETNMSSARPTNV